MVMPVFLLSFGVAISVFLSTMWNASQLAMATGKQRVGHLSIVILMIAILALLGLGGPAEVVQVLAGLLIGATAYLCVVDRARHWPICALQCAFGVIVLSGLPFTLA